MVLGEAQRAGGLRLVGLGGVPLRLEPQQGGRVVARTGGPADDRLQLGPDLGHGVLFQTDGGPVLAGAVGGFFEELNQKFVRLRDGLSGHSGDRRITDMDLI
ncbi:MAG TPA: hypothetical protein VIM46_02790 [Luteolibacter sp.]